VSPAILQAIIRRKRGDGWCSKASAAKGFGKGRLCWCSLHAAQVALCTGPSL